MKKIFLNSNKTEKIKHTIKIFKLFLHILVVITSIAIFNRFI